MSHHVAIIRHGPGTWVHLSRQGSDWLLETVSTAALFTIIGALVDEMRKTGARDDFTFSTLTMREIADAPIPLTPDDLAKWPDASITVFMREGLPDAMADMFVSAWRAPGAGLSSAGTKSRFREKTLPDQITGWFASQRFQSFDPWHPSEPKDIYRPDFARCLLIRGDVNLWNARALLPDVFPVDHVALAEKQRATQLVYDELKRQRDPIERARRLREQSLEDNQILTHNNWIVRLERAIREHEALPFHLQSQVTLDQMRAELASHRQQLHDIKQAIKLRVGLTGGVVSTQPEPPKEIVQPAMYPIPGGGWTSEPPQT
jgi:hypothetical protein